MSRHTPGPWTLSSLPCKSARNKLGLVAGDRRLCDLLVYDDIDEANARLIAAAPKLLAMLRQTYDEWLIYARISRHTEKGIFELLSKVDGE